MSKEKTFVETIREKFGDKVLTSSSDVNDVVSTGSISLDISTGVGGLPLGRFISIYGPDSSGKTTLALSISRQALLKEKKILYIDVEQTLDNTLVKLVLGDTFDSEKFLVIKPETAEQAFQIAEAAIDSKEFKVIIFDSIGAMAPEKELEDDFGDANVALAARLSTTFLRRNAYNVRINNILFIFINQVRASIGTQYAKAYETPGGYAIKHYSSLSIMLTHAEDIYAKKTDKNTAYGNWVKFIIKKNKVGTPHREAKFPIIWGVGIDFYRDTLEFAKMLGIIITKGPYLVFNMETLGQGENKSLIKIRDDKELLDRIIKECYNVVGISSFVGEDSDEE
jgi:recombination protein RecA